MKERNVIKRAIIGVITVCIFSTSAVFAETLDDAKCLNDQVLELTKKGRYLSAIPYAEQSLTIREKILGVSHPDVAQSLNNLAGIYDSLGNYKKAETLYKRSLAILEKALGTEHPAVAISLNNLAGLYGDLGDYSVAESLLKRSLAIRETTLGAEHPDVANSLNNLALIYFYTGRYIEIEPLYKRAIAIYEKARESDHPNVAVSLNNLAGLYDKLGDYTKAEPLYKRALTIQEKTLGTDHPDVAISLSNLAGLYDRLGNYTKAEPLYKRSLAIQEKILGPDHPDTAISLNNLADHYKQLGEYAKAEPLCKRSLEISEKALGPEHPKVATCLSNLAALYDMFGHYAKAEPLYKRSLAIQERVLGPDHPDVATSLNGLAGLNITHLGNYTNAEFLYKRALAIREKAFGTDHPDMAQIMNNLAALYRDLGDYAKAEFLHKRALSIREKAFGPDHPDVANSLINLAALYHDLGDYRKAEPLYKRSLTIQERVLGPDHPDVANSLNDLARFHNNLGDYAKAEPLYKRSLAIQEKVLGQDHPDVANSLNGLAMLYLNLRDYAKAEPLFKRSLSISEKALGSDHPHVAGSLNNLAGLYKKIGANSKALSYHIRSLTIFEKVLGPDHPSVATNLNNLGSIYSNLADYSKAEALFKRSLAIREKALGPDHPSVANSLNNLSGLYIHLGQYMKAEPICKRSLAIFEKALGPYNSNVAVGLSNLAYLYGLTGRYAESYRFYLQNVIINDRIRENAFLALSNRQKLNYVNQTSSDLFGFLSLTAQHMQSDRRAITDTFNAWIRWKGSVMEAQGRYLDAVTYSDDPQTQEKFDDLTNLRREIARLQMSKPVKLTLEQYWRRLVDLDQKKENLETELSSLSRNFKLEKMAGKADNIQLASILPKGSTYLDYAKVDLFNFTQKKVSGSYYLLFVLTPGREQSVNLITLGKSEDVDTHIAAFLIEMNRIKTEGKFPDPETLKKESRAVYDLVLKPAEIYIGDRKKLFISPDGNLNLIPFEVLMDETGKYLLEGHDISYVGAGRDIVKFTDKTIAKGAALVMADPDYDMGLREKEHIAGQMGITEARIRGTISRDTAGMRFERLPDTKPEADAIESLLKDRYHLKVENYQDKKALEEVLFKVRNPHVLHLATHGYFLKAEEVKDYASLGGFRFNMREDAIPVDSPTINIENPMLRSGIILAGANTALREGRDDGVVSAEKILGLRLKGTDLVVLSACETGVGDVQSGEGVFGLKRSFILSGAKTLVMSLWNVPSEETTELMTDFYTLMSKGISKSEALRQAKLNLMKKNSNPYFWGAFVMVGAP